MNDLPNTFLNTFFVILMRRSQKPPYQGALTGINFHCTPLVLKDSSNLSDENSCSSSLAADTYVEALSDSNNLGNDFVAANLQKAYIKCDRILENHPHGRT